MNHAMDLALVPQNLRRSAMRVYGIVDAVNAGEDKLNEQEMNEAGGELMMYSAFQTNLD